MNKSCINHELKFLSYSSGLNNTELMYNKKENAKDLLQKYVFKNEKHCNL